MIFEFPVLNDKVYALPFYIQELGYLDNQDHVIRYSNYTNNQILICTSGKGKLLIEGKEYVISEGDVFFTAKHIPHEYYALLEPWTINWIVFDGPSLEPLLAQLDIHSHEVFEVGTLKSITNIFDDALAIIQSNNAKKHIECSLLIYTLITRLSYCKKSNQIHESKGKKAMTYDMILAYIEKNYARDIALSDLAETFDLSTYYICRVFKHYKQTGLITYLNQYRISMAKKFLLQNPAEPIKNISAQTGFKSNSYFSALFKKTEGMTPNEFRHMHGM